MADDHYQSLPDGGFPATWKNALTVTVTLTPADYFRATYAIRSRSPMQWFGYISCAVVPFLVMPYLYLRGWDPISYPTPLILLFGPVFAVVVVPFTTWLRIWRAFVNTPAAQGPQTYVFGDEGVLAASPLSRTEMKWATFLKVVETRSFFLLFIGPKVARFLPKHALPDPDERHELRQILRANLGDKARLRREP